MVVVAAAAVAAEFVVVLNGFPSPRIYSAGRDVLYSFCSAPSPKLGGRARIVSKIAPRARNPQGRLATQHYGTCGVCDGPVRIGL